MDKELRTEFKLDGFVMRAWSEDDIDAVLKLVLENREHLQTYMHWMSPGYSIDDARNFLVGSIGDQHDRKSLALSLVRNGKLIGSTGFSRLDWPARVCEIGYWIDHREEGKGTVTKACKALIEYAFEELELNRIEIRCASENIRSAAIPLRLGFREEGYLRQSAFRNGRFHDYRIFGLLADDPRVW